MCQYWDVLGQELMFTLVLSCKHLLERGFYTTEELEEEIVF